MTFLLLKKGLGRGNDLVFSALLMFVRSIIWLWFGYFRLFASIPRFEKGDSTKRYGHVPSKYDEYIPPPKSYAHAVSSDK